MVFHIIYLKVDILSIVVYIVVFSCSSIPVYFEKWHMLERMERVTRSRWTKWLKFLGNPASKNLLLLLQHSLLFIDLHLLVFLVYILNITRLWTDLSCLVPASIWYYFRLHCYLWESFVRSITAAIIMYITVVSTAERVLVIRVVLCSIGAVWIV